MDHILLWFWTGILVATILWWLMMLIRVAFIGPVELLAMFHSLDRSSNSETDSMDLSARSS
jgi:hypothetical protein